MKKETIENDEIAAKHPVRIPPNVVYFYSVYTNDVYRFPFTS